MAITYTNTYYDDIIENLATIINNEMSIPIYYDEHRGNHSFLITPESDNLVDYLSGGIHREFNVNIEYKLKIGGQYNKNNFKQVSNIMERLKRLVYNNQSYNSGENWFEAKIENVEYERDEENLSTLRAVAVFNCQNIEAI